MAKRRRRKRAPKVLEEEIVEEVLVNDDEDEEDEEEVIEEKPKPKRRRRKAKPVAEATTEEKPKRRRRRKTKPVEEVIEDVEEQDDVIATTDAEGVTSILFDLMDAGLALTINKVGMAYVFSKVGRAVPGVPSASTRAALKGREFNDIARSEEFKEFRTFWKDLSFEEKVEEAIEAGAEWTEHENPRVEVMRLTAAYRKVKGIEKWKPEYRTKKARDALKYGGVQAD